MALTITTVKPAQVIAPDYKRAVLEVTFDSSYPTGGEAIDLSDYGFTTVTGCIVQGDTVVDASYKFDLVGTRANGGLTASTCLLAGVYQTDPADTGGANIPFVEVTSTADLSAVVVTLTVEGF